MTDKPDTTLVALTMEQLQALLASSQTASKEDQIEIIRAQADATAEATRRLVRPENTQAPGLGIFSRPGGELKNPKGEFKYRLTWAGFPVDKDTVTAEEFDLLNALSPGHYLCTRPDGSRFPVDITATLDPVTGQADRLDVFFATRGQLRHGLPSMVVMCRDLIAQAKIPVKVA